jgi:hypothetical protein
MIGARGDERGGRGVFVDDLVSSLTRIRWGEHRVVGDERVVVASSSFKLVHAMLPGESCDVRAKITDGLILQ